MKMGGRNHEKNECGNVKNNITRDWWKQVKKRKIARGDNKQQGERRVAQLKHDNLKNFICN
jgi:hypothetical protein